MIPPGLYRDCLATNDVEVLGEAVVTHTGSRFVVIRDPSEPLFELVSVSEFSRPLTVKAGEETAVIQRFHPLTEE